MGPLLKVALAFKRPSMTSTVASKLALSSNESQADCSPLSPGHKCELIGELAQAMANQFNNIMMAVTGYAELELKKTSVKDRRALEQVLTHATQATLLIQKLLDFSRKHSSSPQPLELDEVITGISELMKRMLGEEAELSLRLDAHCGIVYADRIDVEQTLLALVLVERNAMPTTGKLILSTSLTNPSEESTGTQYVELSIESDAATIRDDSAAGPNLDRSQGVNSSLAAVREIAKDCCEFVRVSNGSGGRSGFKLYFPVSKKETIEVQGPTLPRIPAVARTVLIVEDDDAVRVPAAEFLMMEGFKVLQARTGSEALNVVQQSRSSLDMLIADIFMPKMSGHQVAAKLLEEHPDLKILYMSGDPGRSGGGDNKSPQQATLRKPFRLNALRDKIHDLLGE
jgi:two-component system, cell cycle sensor histidine kinase and response regulator CckA